MKRFFSMGVRWIAQGIALLSTLSIPLVTFAQNCQMCYTQAAGSGTRMIQALRGGIIVLVIPPVLICAGITVMAYKKRNKFNE